MNKKGEGMIYEFMLTYGWAILVVLVAIGALAYFGVLTPEKFMPEKTNNTELTLGQCLTEHGVKMYGASWCTHCANQKNAFGDDFNNVDYVECTEKLAECNQNGIEGYPTWVINGTNYPGERTLTELAQLSGCP